MPAHALIYTKEFEKLNYGPDHPFCPERFKLTLKYFKEKLPHVPIIPPNEYDISILEKVHSKKYIKTVKEYSEKGYGYLSIDTPVFPGIFEWAVTYTWASLTALELIISGEKQLVFNPCGGLHHARRDSDGGFCVFNDVALCAIYASERNHKVAIVDIDGHAGDGTMRILYDKPILKISVHEDPNYLYPGDGFIDQVGIKDGYGYTINIPLPPGATDDILIKAFEKIVIPALRAFDPEIIILQSGVDGYRKDPLTHLKYTSHGYHNSMLLLRRLSRPIVMLGGGGYYIKGVPILWATIFTTLSGEFNAVRKDAEETDPIPTRCDEYLCQRADLIIQTILETHPFFTKFYP